MFRITILENPLVFQKIGNVIYFKSLHDAICMPHICLSKGYLDNSIMHENFKRNLDKHKNALKFKVVIYNVWTDVDV